ncbi:MAG TPA: hypothetical protein VK447_04450 [Myxococcaceae bacterium]|nr:hypothetical protein [Myxococcaceae bacterium]
MKHVFVETNWVVDVAAPAHHRVPAAVELLERAKRGELKLHLPAISIIEARRAIPNRFEPRNEADAIRRFLGAGNTSITPEEKEVVYRLLSQYEQTVRTEFRMLEQTLQSLIVAPGLEVFALSERMLKLQVELSPLNLNLHPFDQAVLAAVLGRAEELRALGESDFTFCELDSDLQPWNKNGGLKQPLTRLYDERRIWVFGEYGMDDQPSPPAAWSREGA